MGNGRQCSESCLDYVLAEVYRHYSSQKNGPPSATAIEAIGFRVGCQLVERYTKDKSRMSEQLELMKFICRDFWMEVFKKQVDGLRTNHKGTFVLRDNTFRWVAKLSTNVPDPDTGVEAGPAVMDVAKDQLAFPCALIRGALAQLGVDATVTADPAQLPVIEFTVFIKQRGAETQAQPAR